MTILQVALVHILVLDDADDMRAGGPGGTVDVSPGRDRLLTKSENTRCAHGTP